MSENLKRIPVRSNEISSRPFGAIIIRFTRTFAPPSSKERERERVRKSREKNRKRERGREGGGGGGERGREGGGGGEEGERGKVT